MATSVILLALVFVCEMGLAEMYVIERRPYDRFVIPTSLCATTATSELCHKMGAHQLKKDYKLVECTCECVSVFATVFGFFNNTWNCERNSVVRKHAAGCYDNLYLNNKATTGTLLVVNVDSIKNKIGEIHTYPATNCTLQNELSYLDCHGAWRRMNHGGKGFTLVQNHQSKYYYDLYNNGNLSFSQHNPPLYGRVIKLNIRCTSQRVEHYRVVLKVQGQLRCESLVVTIPTVLQPSSPLCSSSSPSSSSLPPPKPFQTSSTIMTIKSTFALSGSSSTSSSTTSSIQSTLFRSSRRPSESISAKRTASTKLQISTQPVSIVNKKNADIPSIIAGAVVGVLALLVVFFVTFIIRNIKKKRNSASERRDPNPVIYDSIYDEPLESTHAGQQTPIDNQYDYAYAGRVVRNQNRATRQISATNNPTYDQCAPVPEDPVYSTLEDPDTVKPEPMHNVLEGPGNEESSYDEVGGIIFTDIKVYNGLKGLDVG